jgi:hypothetical protein
VPSRGLLVDGLGIIFSAIMDIDDDYDDYDDDNAINNKHVGLTS